jgi:hypothetical protein
VQTPFAFRHQIHPGKQLDKKITGADKFSQPGEPAGSRGFLCCAYLGYHEQLTQTFHLGVQCPATVLGEGVSLAIIPSSYIRQILQSLDIRTAHL